MIDKLIAFSLNNKVIIGLMTIALIFGGIWSMKQVPVDAVPDITNNQVQIITISPNLGTEDVEQFLTYPVELEMSNLPGVEELRSTSRFGLSVVTIVFKENMGTYLPRQLVSEKLADIKENIPAGMGEPMMAPIATGLGEIYQYTLDVDSSYRDQYSMMDLRTIQDWIVKRRLALTPGVVEINTFGGATKTYEVAVDPAKLHSMNISILDVFDALEKNNANTGGAYIEKYHRANFIRGAGLMKSTDDIENTVIKTINERPILISDVAQVQFGQETRYGAATKNGTGDAVGGIIMMLKDENSGEVIQRVKDKIENINTNLPEGIQIKPFLDRSKLVAQTTSTVATNLIEGGLIVIFILVLLLGNWRGGLVVASTIPLTLLFAFILMNIFGVSANLMSLGAIDFGIIIDGAVIIVEAFLYMWHTKYVNKVPSKNERDQLAKTSASKMMNSAFFGQLIILIVFTPILALTGVEGKMFKPMALTFSFAMIGAMILCLTYVPMVTAVFIKEAKDKKKTWGDKIVLFLERKYKNTLGFILDKKIAIISIATVLLLSSGFVFSRLGGEFIPQLDEGDLAYHAIMKPGTSLSETIKATTIIEEKLIEKFPEIEDIVSRIGVADVPTDPMPMDIADAFVILKPKEEWTSAASKEELIRLMKIEMNNVPGVNYEFSQPIEMRFNELISGVREDIAIKIFGEDTKILAKKAKEAAKYINSIDGVDEMRVEATSGMPQITIDYNRAQMARYGLSIDEINKIVNTAFAGGTAGTIFEGERRFDLVVKLNQDNKKEIKDVEQLLIPIANGHQIPLSEVAMVKYEDGPMQISRENTNRRIYIGINVTDVDIQTLVENIQEVLNEKLTLPPGYFIEYGGSFENLTRAKDRLLIIVPIALALIFILVYLALKSFKQTVMIYLAIPMAAMGGIFAIWMRDMPFSISAGVGFIVLFGVAVLNGLVLISGLNELAHDSSLSLRERIIEGTKRRIRPILLTATTDVLGFLPMALSTGAGAEVQQPLATVVIGGLLSATLLTLFVLPILYEFVESRQKKTNTGNNTVVQAAAALLLICTGISTANAQTGEILNIDQALNYAQQNYPAIKKAELYKQQGEAYKQGRLNFGNTVVSYSGDEIGNNGANVVTPFQVSQNNIDLFGYKGKNEYYKTQIKNSNSKADLTVVNVMQTVSSLWYNAFIDASASKKIENLDNIFQQNLKVAQALYDNGEISRSQFLTAKNRRIEIKSSLLEIQQEAIRSKQQLAVYIQVSPDFKFPNEVPSIDTISFNKEKDEIVLSNPYYAFISSQTDVDKAAIKLAKTKLLPKLNLSWGTQKSGDATGLQTYQVGVNIPLFNSKIRRDVKLAKINYELSTLQQQETAIQVESAWNSLVNQYKKTAVIIDFQNKEVIPSLEEQLNVAQIEIKNGEIDFLTLALTFDAYRKALIIQSQTQKEYYSTLIQLSYFGSAQ